MTTGLLILCVVLMFLGTNAALIAWFVVRLFVGPIWALIALNAVFAGTCYAILQLV